jgi:hypothetical protein
MKKVWVIVLIALLLEGCGGDLARTNPLDPFNDLKPGNPPPGVDITTKVATPLVTPGTGVYTGTIYVTVSCSTPGAEVRVTLDGTDPSPLQTSTPRRRALSANSSIAVTESVVLKAKAFAPGLSSSDIAVVPFSINGIPPPPPPRLISGTIFQGDVRPGVAILLKEVDRVVASVVTDSLGMWSVEVPDTNTDYSVTVAAGSSWLESKFDISVKSGKDTSVLATLPVCPTITIINNSLQVIYNPPIQIVWRVDVSFNGQIGWTHDLYRKFPIDPDYVSMGTYASPYRFVQEQDMLAPQLYKVKSYVSATSSLAETNSVLTYRVTMPVSVWSLPCQAPY